MFNRSGVFWRYGCSETASILPIAALLFPVIIGMAGAGIDISSWLMTRRHLQTAADAAALAGAWDIANGSSESEIEDAALREAENNGYDPTQDGTLEITVTTDPDSAVRTVKVDIQQKVDVWFSSVFIDKTVYAVTTASAIEIAGGPFCILGLDQNEVGAVEAAGTVDMDSPTCGIAVNSDSSSALSLVGNVQINVGEVKIVGNYDTTGSPDFTYTKLRTGASPTADPYVDLTIPAFTSCSEWNMAHDNNRYTADATLNPGVFCGGLTIVGTNEITLNPGVYIMDGGNFDVSGGGSISGTDVTIILTNSGGLSYGDYGNISMSANKTIYLKAPTTGDYAGVAVYQDRNAPTGSNTNFTNRVTGTVGVEVEGVIYTPSRELYFGGHGRVLGADDPICTKLIAKKVLFQGNPAIGSDCTGSGTEDIGNASARLVL